MLTAVKAGLKITLLFLFFLPSHPLALSSGRTFTFFFSLSKPEHGLRVGSLLNLIRFFHSHCLPIFLTTEAECRQREKGGLRLTQKHDSPSLPFVTAVLKAPLPTLPSFHHPLPAFLPIALPEQGLSSVIKYPWSGRNQPWMFITLGQLALMEKLLQTMSSPQGNRVADTKQY